MLVLRRLWLWDLGNYIIISYPQLRLFETSAKVIPWVQVLTSPGVEYKLYIEGISRLVEQLINVVINRTQMTLINTKKLETEIS